MKKSCLILFYLFLALSAHSQHYTANQFTTLHGLPSNSIRSSFIDSHDWLWIGTNSGLARYQNGRFERFPGLDTLNGMQVWAIAEDGADNLWFGTYGNGLARFDGDNLVWYNSSDTSFGNDLIRIVEYLPATDQLLIGGRDSFLVWEKDQMKNYELPKTKNPIQVVDFLNLNDTIFILSNDTQKVFNFYIPETREFGQKKHQYEEKNFWSGIKTSKGELYLGVERQEYYYETDKEQFYQEGIGQVFDWLEDPYGNVWAAAWGGEAPGGLFQFKDGKMTNFSKLLGYDNLLGWSLEYDYTNNCLWFLTLDQGLIQIPQPIFEQIELPQSYEKNFTIRDIASDSSNNLWIVSNNALIIYENGTFRSFADSVFINAFLKENRDHFDEWYEFTKYPPPPDSSYSEMIGDENFKTKNPFSHNLIMLIKLLQLDPNIIESVDNKNIYNQLKTELYNKPKPLHINLLPEHKISATPYAKNKILVYIYSNIYSLNLLSNEIKYLGNASGDKITFINDHQVYFTGMYNSIFLVSADFVDDSLYNLRTLQHQDYKNLPGNIVSIGTSNNRVWLGSRFSGLFITDKNDFIQLNETYPGLPQNITSIAFDADSLTFAGCSDGAIYIFTNYDNLVTLRAKISTKNGLDGQAIQWMQNDNQGYLWVGTNTALNRIDLKTLYNNQFADIKHFGIEDGYNAFASMSSTIDLLGNIYVDAGNKILKINTRLANQNTNTDTKVSLDKIELFLKPIQEQSGLDIHPWTKLPKKASFAHDQNYFSFHFSSNNRLKPDNDRYSFRLIGLDTSWSASATVQKAVFTNLDPGNYQLQIKLNNGKAKASIDYTYPFKIEKAWWQQWWFIILVSAVSIILLSLGIHFRLLYLKDQSQRRYQVQQQMAELKLQALQAQMNPHFIFNVLTAIQNAILKNDIDNAINYLTDVSRLIRTTLDYASEKFISLDDEIIYLKNYLRLEKLRMNGKLNTTIEVDSSLLPENTAVPPMLIQPLVENAIKHGVSRLSDEGFISIRFELLNETTYTCTVEDNGPGFKQNRSTSHVSRGLEMIYKRIKLLNEEHGKEVYKFTAFDKSEIKSGTRMVLELKI